AVQGLGDWALLCRQVMNGDRLLKPRRCPEEMFRIVERCWHAEPECRPAFASVYRSILEFTGEDNLPLESKAQ
ncbi:unnamed protein product, partial [Porites evermanni]